MGSIIVDIIIIIIFAISVFVAYSRGIIAIIYNLICWLVIALFIFIFYKPITNVIVDRTTFDEVISSKIEKNLENSFEDGIFVDEENSSISNAFINIINEYALEAQEAEVENVAEYVANEISYTVISAIVMLALFVFAKIVAFLVQYILEFIVSIPLIRTFNKSAGVIYGVIRAFLMVYIILAIISLISPLLANMNIVSFIKSSYIGSIFYNNNIILNLLNK